MTEVDRGTFAGPSKVTVGEYLEEWLRSAVRGKAANTESAYRHGIQPAIDRLGAKPLQKLTTRDVEDLVDWMLTEGRKRGGKPGTPLSPRAVQITLGKIKTALDDAVHRRLVAYNVAGPVKCPPQVKTKRTPWSPAEVRTFLGSLAGDRLHAPMLLLCDRHAAGGSLRPALGGGRRPRGRDADHRERPHARLDRSRAASWSRRAPRPRRATACYRCPVSSSAALRALKATQAAERLAAGEAYTASGYVLVDELGLPFRTDQLRRAAYRQMTKAGVRKVRLYDARPRLSDLPIGLGRPRADRERLGRSR